MHLLSTVSALMLLCACISSIRGVTDDGPDDGRAFNEPKTKRSGKLPRWSFDLGPLNIESYFQEQKLEDRLRLSKAYIKHHVRSNLYESEDPLFTVKHSRVEELINCENLTTLIKVEGIVSVIDCRPLEAHTIDDSYVSPVSDQTITQYVRRSSFRTKTGGTLFARSSRHDLLIYPLRREVTLGYLGTFIKLNELGDVKAINSKINLGYYVQAEITSKESATPITCTGRVFLSINRSSIGYSRRSDDPYPEYVDDANFLLEQAQKNGYLISLHDFSCGVDDLPIDVSLKIDFSLMQQHEFPYLFVHHTMTTSPLDVFLKYHAFVKQRPNNQATGKPSESYNTTVSIRSSSGLFKFMNFVLDQEISNDDLNTGFETAKFITTQFPIIVTSFWNKNEYFKQIRFMEVFKTLEEPLKDILNITFTNNAHKDGVIFLMELKKTLLTKFWTGLDMLDKALGLDDKLSYDMTPEDEHSVREEL